MIVHFDISRERSIKAVEAAMLRRQEIFLVTQKDPETENPGISDLYRVGTIAYIKQVVKLPHDLLRVLVEGRERAELLSLVQEETFLEAEISGSTQEEAQYADTVREAMYRGIHGLFHQYCMESGKVSRELAAQIMNIENLEELMTQISVNISLTWQNKQKLLEAATLEERYEVLGGDRKSVV